MKHREAAPIPSTLELIAKRVSALDKGRGEDFVSAQEAAIARHLSEALESGELAGTPGFGKPMPGDDGWNATPEALRMPFKILKNAGVVPAEVGMFHERAALGAQLEACDSEVERAELRRKLMELQQKIALRLEALRVDGTL